MRLTRRLEGRAVVTGGAGLIGAQVSAALLLEDLDHVVAIDPRLNSQGYMPEDSARFHWLREPISGERARIELGAAHYVFHLAASTGTHVKSPLDDVRGGLELTIQALEAVDSSILKKFIFCSSSAVYGLSAAIPAKETMGPLVPCSTYGASKLAGEAWVQVYAARMGFGAVLCRLGNIISADLDRGALVDIASQMASQGGAVRLLGNGEQGRTYLSTRRCADALVHLAASGLSEGAVEVVNISGHDLVTTKELVYKIGHEMKVLPRISTSTKDAAGWTGDVPIVVLNLEKLIGLGWSPPSSSEAVGEAIQGIVGRFRVANGV